MYKYSHTHVPNVYNYYMHVVSIQMCYPSIPSTCNMRYNPLILGMHACNMHVLFYVTRMLHA